MTASSSTPAGAPAGGHRPAAAVVVAGGRGNRLGGQDKPALRIGGSTLLEIALTAVGNVPVVVVGPARELPDNVVTAREEPPGGGPAAAVATGLAALPDLPDDALVAVLAADLPGITGYTVDRLCVALSSARWPHATATPDLSAAASPVAPQQLSADGAVLIDPAGRRQYLAGVWRFAALQAAVERRRSWHGVALRELLDPIRTIDVAGSANETADVDTPADWRRWQS